jgi:hypothetical protein
MESRGIRAAGQAARPEVVISEIVMEYFTIEIA